MEFRSFCLLTCVNERPRRQSLPCQQETDVPKDGIAHVSDEYGPVSITSRDLKPPTPTSNSNINNKNNLITNNNNNNNCNSSHLAKWTVDQMNFCKEVWRRADAVCFDVDSTVCCDEAIDELAKYVGKSKEVSEITKTAMLGGANFRDALAQRLKIIQPNRRILVEYMRNNKPRLTDYIEELVARLHESGRDVYLISGGFDIIIQPTAKILNIPFENIFANRIKFYFDGSYAGFDKSMPTSNQDGKSRVIAMLKQTKGYKNVVMIGDGVTDLEACPPADAFIGFGGNQIRETVRRNADWFVYSFKELISEL